MDLIYMGSRKRQDLLSKLESWGPWQREEGEGREKKGSREKCRAQQKSIIYIIRKISKAEKEKSRTHMGICFLHLEEMRISIMEQCINYGCQYNLLAQL